MQIHVEEREMRSATVLSLLAVALIGWYACGFAPPASAERALVLIPTAIQELKELRIQTTEKAVMKDGTMSAVYVKHFPAEGNAYLNFHVDVATEAGPFVLHPKGIRLEGPAAKAGTPGGVSYTPLDWFLDTGQEEVRGDSLTVKDKAIVQFTIEVPRTNMEDLVLFVHSERIGTVGEIRERIAGEQQKDKDQR
jgi:hypothetical protein